MIIAILQSQLEASNETVKRLNATIESMEASFNATISELKATISNLENLLKERDESLGKAASQMRGMKATFLPKKSERQNLPTKPQTPEEEVAAEEERKARIKARGNNGAKRKDYFAVETKEEDVYPGDIDLNTSVEVGVRDVIRYEMIRPSFIKHIYHIYALRCGDVIASGKAPATPLQNSRFDGSFIVGIAELRYLYSMPLERIVKYFQGNGFDIDKQTAHGLLKKTAELFEKLYKAMRLAVKEGTYLNCDESYHTVLVKNEDGKGSKKGYIWVIACKETGLVFFFYDDGSRSEEVILKEFKEYQGRIQSDGLGAYKKVALQSGGKIIRLACSCRCNGINFFDYLSDVLNKAADLQHLTPEAYRNLLPDRWTKE